MPWRCTAREDLDDDHAAAAAWTSRLAGIDGGSGRLAFRFCNGEQLTRTCNVVVPIVILALPCTEPMAPFGGAAYWTRYTYGGWGYIR